MGRFRGEGRHPALGNSALGGVSYVPAGGDTPLLEDLAQVSAVEGFVEEVLEYHTAVQAVVLELVRHPGM